MLYYVYFSDAGMPKTGLTPSWETLETAKNGTDKTGAAPTIMEVGGGWYNCEITYGATPWDVTTEDLVGVINGGSSLAEVDRYKPIVISLRGLGLARIAHKGVQNKTSGVIDIYGIDGTSKEIQLVMEDDGEEIRRIPSGV